MRLVHESLAGTLESSDALVRISPADTLRIEVTSSVQAQFGESIRALVEDELSRLGITAGHITVNDKGALDFVLRARIQAAVLRSCDEKPDWRTL